MKLNPLVSALIVGGALLAPHALVQAQTKPIELRYSSGAPPKGNPWVMQIERFAKDVDEESKGESQDPALPWRRSWAASRTRCSRWRAGASTWAAIPAARPRWCCRRWRCC